jgi:ankyrin repeat protein
MAAYRGHIAIVSYLIEMGAEVDVRSEVGRCVSPGVARLPAVVCSRLIRLQGVSHPSLFTSTCGISTTVRR